MKRWSAFSLVEMAVVLMIAGMLLMQVPVLMKIYKTHQAKQQIDLALKSLGAYVAQNHPLPEPDPPRKDEEFILRGTLPYKKLGITKKHPEIQYAVDRQLTKCKLLTNFCDKLDNHFLPTDLILEDDLIACELSVGETKNWVTRNNFAAQYCDHVCPKLLNRPDVVPPTPAFNNNVATVTAQQLSPEERDYFQAHPSAA
ncbi:MAG: hypothetical protein AAB323_00205 [Pseudomonadota bacterium]